MIETTLSLSYAEFGLMVIVGLTTYLLGCFQGVNYNLKKQLEQKKEKQYGSNNISR